MTSHVEFEMDFLGVRPFRHLLRRPCGLLDGAGGVLSRFDHDAADHDAVIAAMAFTDHAVFEVRLASGDSA